MIYPRFSGETFWNFAAACEIFGARYPTPPLGLITVAALLPPSWSVRLVDRNVEELTESDLEWADLVMTGGMLPQHDDLLEIIDVCRKRETPVTIGGPAATSVPNFYSRANFQVLGEVEDVLGEFVAAWEAGAREGVFQAKKFEIDVRKTPIPRFDLLKFDHYLYVGVQFSRGCPFTCEFCDIIELYGRVPRTKSNAQMLAELDKLYQLGYRGHVDFVDDNLIGNKKAVKAFLPELKAWLERHDYPFEFTTEASLNLADDQELLRLMNEANFVGVFMGIESPDPDTLFQMSKKQNTRRNIADSIHKIYAAGMFVTAGFIVGFDTEKSGMAEAMVALIEDAAIPVCMVGLLYALPNTQLARRLTKEGRLHPPPEFASSRADQCTLGLNFDTLRPRQEVLTDYKNILERVYHPAAFAGRLQRLANLLDNSNRKRQGVAGDSRRKFQSTVQRIIDNLPDCPDAFRRILVQCATSNPNSLRSIVTLMAFYLHLGPFSRHVVAQIEHRIADLDEVSLPQRAPTDGPTYPAPSA
ncbi:DUF4070 domain-containing protein [Pseudorhodoplanes sp.]|uniref:DUF4070 domain-containing protein n=1 Tax=Pseudorhodoplanes sp. TaxID=1934341 RepID=UPI00391CFEED